MIPAPLVFDALVDFAIAASYAVVGRTLADRRVSPEAELAAHMFSVWWYGLAATGLFAGALSLLAAVGVRDLPVLGMVSRLTSLAFCVAMWGLVSYLGFLFLGDRRVVRWVGVLYAAYFFLSVYQHDFGHAIGVDAEGWRPLILYERAAPLALSLLSLGLLIVPQVAGALAYLSLLRKVDARAQRYRIVLFSTSIFLWTLGVLTISRPDAAHEAVWQITGRAIVLLSAFSMLGAYRVPPWVARRLHLEPDA